MKHKAEQNEKKIIMNFNNSDYFNKLILLLNNNNEFFQIELLAFCIVH